MAYEAAGYFGGLWRRAGAHGVAELKRISNQLNGRNYQAPRVEAAWHLIVRPRRGARGVNENVLY